MRTAGMPCGWLVAAAACLAACASGGAAGAAPSPASPTPYDPTAAQPPAPSAPPRAPDALRYGPGAARYVVHRELHIQQGVGEQARIQDLGTRCYVALAIAGPSDSLGYPATVTVDSVIGDSGTPAPLRESLDRARRLVFSGRVAPGGEFRNVVPSDSAAAQALVQLLGGFRDFLPRIPRRGLELGAAWTDTLERTQRREGLEVTIHAVARGRAAAWEAHAGARSLRVESSIAYTLAGTGRNAGQPVELQGQGAGTGASFLSATGRFLGSEARDSADLTYRFLNEGVAVAVIQVIRTTVTVVP